MSDRRHPGLVQNEKRDAELADMGAGFVADRARKQREHDQAVRDRYEREGRTHETQLERLDRIERRGRR